MQIGGKKGDEEEEIYFHISDQLECISVYLLKASSQLPGSNIEW